jgi:selenocysteine lyase/cysteine desulfurase
MAFDKFGEHATKKGFRIRLVAESHLNSIRVSTHLYNNFDEITKFVEAVKEVA